MSTEKTKKEKREWKIYCKQLKKHRKNLIFVLKEDKDFDYRFLHALVMQKLNNMLDFWQEDCNVHSSDTVREGNMTTLAEAIKLGNRLGSNCSELEDDEKQAYKNFYSYIGEHITEWWD